MARRWGPCGLRVLGREGLGLSVGGWHSAPPGCGGPGPEDPDFPRSSGGGDRPHVELNVNRIKKSVEFVFVPGCSDLCDEHSENPSLDLEGQTHAGEHVTLRDSVGTGWAVFWRDGCSAPAEQTHGDGPPRPTLGPTGRDTEKAGTGPLG